MPAVESTDRSDRITVQETADLLGISVNSVYRAAKRGELPSWRVGHVIRFSRRAIERFIADGGTTHADRSHSSPAVA